MPSWFLKHIFQWLTEHRKITRKKKKNSFFVCKIVLDEKYFSLYNCSWLGPPIANVWGCRFCLHTVELKSSLYAMIWWCDQTLLTTFLCRICIFLIAYSTFDLDCMQSSWSFVLGKTFGSLVGGSKISGKNHADFWVLFGWAGFNFFDPFPVSQVMIW